MLTFENARQELRKPISDARLRVVVAGDVCPRHSGLEAILAGKSQEILEDIQPYLDEAEIRLVQFEAPLTNAETAIDKSGPNLKCPPECIDFVKTGKFDVALLANNHIGDYGPDPVMETIETFRAGNILTVGAGKDLVAACEPLKLERNNLKVAVVNIAEHEFGTAGKNKAGSAPLEPVTTCATIRKAAADSDVTLVIMHGGNEHNPVPSPRMVRICRAFVEAGANAVVNIHPHCPQGIEVWRGAPIVYSPGNFFFPFRADDEFDPANFWWSGYLPRFEFDRQGVFAVEVTPYISRTNPEKIQPLAGKQLKEMLAYLSELSGLAADPQKVGEYFDAWCVMRGPGVLTRMRKDTALWPIDLDQREQVSSMLALRNIFTCEAHCELMTNFLRLIEEGRVEQGSKLVPEIQRLQHAGFLL